MCLYLCNTFYLHKFYSYSIITSTSMEGNVRTVRSFKKLKPIAEVLEAEEYITRLLPSPTTSLLSCPNDQHGSSSTASTLPSLGSPFNELGSLGGSSSSQRRLI